MFKYLLSAFVLSLLTNNSFSQGILEYKTSHSPKLVPIRKEVAYKQLDTFKAYLLNPLDNYQENNTIDFFVSRNSFITLIEKYKNNDHFNTIGISVVEIDKDIAVTTGKSYYLDNDRKIHLLFFAVDKINNRRIDDKYYDLIEEVSGEDIFEIYNEEALLMFEQYEDGSRNVMNSIGTTYQNNVINNTETILVNLKEMKLILDSTIPDFDKFHIRMSLIYNWPECTEPKLANRDKLLNLLFFLADRSHQELPNAHVYDMNELCPPGNCFDLLSSPAERRAKN